jgi:hypothetical protein
MARPVSLLTELCLLIFARAPIVYAIRTLVGMHREEPHPLLRIRLTAGSMFL